MAISNTDDVIDSRDVIERIEELEAERDDAVTQGDEHTVEWEQENGSELEALRKLAAQAEGYAPDWRYGETLIRDSYFQDYAQQLAEDIGAIDGNAKWPNTCIDWEQAAHELQMDYTSVDFDGVTYWVR